MLGVTSVFQIPKRNVYLFNLHLPDRPQFYFFLRHIANRKSKRFCQLNFRRLAIEGFLYQLGYGKLWRRQNYRRDSCILLPRRPERSIRVSQRATVPLCLYILYVQVWKEGVGKHLLHQQQAYGDGGLDFIFHFSLKISLLVVVWRSGEINESVLLRFPLYLSGLKLHFKKRRSTLEFFVCISSVSCFYGIGYMRKDCGSLEMSEVLVCFRHNSLFSYSNCRNFL